MDAGQDCLNCKDKSGKHFLVEGCLPVDVVAPCLPVSLNPMSYLAHFYCSLTDAVLDSFDVRDEDDARGRHKHQSHPRPVTAVAHIAPAAH
ncbi:MAG TPA: hypothetical protein VF427_14260 [Noviherbaspirillum sp.]